MATLIQGADSMLSKKSSKADSLAPHDVYDARFESFDILCFSHLRWDFVFQRPQHLLTRAAKMGRVFYWEEPLFEQVESAYLRERTSTSGVVVVQPVLAREAQNVNSTLRTLLAGFVRSKHLEHFVSWFYTPMATAFADDLQPDAVVYDCMDELSAFRGAPPELVERESALLQRADVVFVGGASLFESKKHRHSRIHLFPSSVEVPHFEKARRPQADPIDQQEIPHPRVGFYGVLDERLDTDLLTELADRRKEMHFVILGPLAKITEADLPRRDNLHFLGPKTYDELPQYLAGWDAAMLPFALNEATRFISPTKTPEYLAAWKQVVSTAIRDVVSPYGDAGLVAISRDAESFVQALDDAVQAPTSQWKADVDRMLSRSSWDSTWNEMQSSIAGVLASRTYP